MAEKENRMVYVDIIKTIAMLWIVGYWHLKPFIGTSHTEPSFWLDGYLTNLFLGAFMFFSGFCLSKYSFKSFVIDSVFFYKKRFLRFYPLYVISLVTLFLLLRYQGLNLGMNVLITSLFGISSYIQPQPPTLWFFSMLISFYAITPLIMVFKRIWQRGGVILLFFVLGIVADKFLPLGIDQRFFWYFPIYTLGLMFGANKIIENYSNIIFGISLPISLAVLLFMHSMKMSYGAITLLQFVFILTSLMVLIWLIKRTSGSRFWKPVLALSGCSMCAYLFHRQIYTILYAIYVRLGFNYGYWLTAITFIPICLGICLLIQRLYDRFISPKLANKLFS